MGKITSGGLKGFSSGTSKKFSVNPYPNDESLTREQPQQDIQEEGTLGYLARNTAKIPALLYSGVRSGLGLGNLLDLYARKGTNTPEAREIIQGGLRNILPTRQQAHEEISGILPKYYTESRPGDEPAEFVASELPFIAASGGLKSAASLGKSALSSLGILGGSQVGRSVGGALGQELGDEEIGQLLGSYAGGTLGSKSSNYISNRPSKVISPKIYEKEKNIFEGNKKERLENITGAKKSFENQKKKTIKEYEKDINNYKHKIKHTEEIRNPLYERAAKLEGSSKGNAKNVRKIVNEVSQELGKGVGSADSSSILHNLQSVENAISNGSLSLKDAKTLQKNFNDQIYNKGVSNSFKRQMNKVVSSLNDFIKETGSEEHTQAWDHAEQSHREFKTLQRGEKDFIKNKQKEIRDVKQEKFNLSPQEYNEAIRAIGKETYEDLLKSKESQSNLIKALEGIKSGATKYGLGGIGAVLGYLGFGNKGALLFGPLGKLASTSIKEVNIARNAFKNHPEIFKEYGTLIKNAPKMDKVKLLNQVNNLGSKIEEIEPTQESVSSSVGRITKGGIKGITKGGLKVSQ